MQLEIAEQSADQGKGGTSGPAASGAGLNAARQRQKSGRAAADLSHIAGTQREKAARRRRLLQARQAQEKLLNDIDARAASGDRSAGDLAPSELLAWDGMGSVRQIMNAFLHDYNAISQQPMPLTLFRYAVQHCARIARVLKMPGGHALLVGLPGSGRASLCRLAAYMGGHEIVQVESSGHYGLMEWRDDLKSILEKAGTSVAGGPESAVADAMDGGSSGGGGDGGSQHSGSTVLLLSEAQLRHTFVLEDLNALLSTGDVPDLFSPGEKGVIAEKMRPMARAKMRAKQSASLTAYADGRAGGIAGVHDITDESAYVGGDGGGDGGAGASSGIGLLSAAAARLSASRDLGVSECY